MKYVIRFWYRGQTEEYEGGINLDAARHEAAYFREHIPAGTEIRICKLVGGLPFLVEVMS